MKYFIGLHVNDIFVKVWFLCSKQLELNFAASFSSSKRARTLCIIYLVLFGRLQRSQRLFQTNQS